MVVCCNEPRLAKIVVLMNKSDSSGCTRDRLILYNSYEGLSETRGRPVQEGPRDLLI